MESNDTGPEESRKRERTVWLLGIFVGKRLNQCLAGIWTINATQVKEENTNSMAFA